MISRLLRNLDRRLFDANLSVYPRELDRVLAGPWQSLLDVGCGPHSPLRNVCRQIPYTMGVDVHTESIDQSRAAGIHTDYRRMDISEIADHFGPASFDVVAALDVLEHLPKEDGYRFLNSLETVAKFLVIIFTPNGFLKQDPTDENPWQEHRSGWRPQELRDRGYRVQGINGWRPLRGECWEPRIRPPAVGHRLAALTQPLVSTHPELAFQLLAVRQQEG